MLALIITATFLAVTLLFTGLSLETGTEATRRRIHRFSWTSHESDEPQRVTFKTNKDGLVQLIVAKLANLSDRYAKETELQRIEEQLDTAGRPWGLEARQFMGLRIGSVIVFSAAGFGGMFLIGVSNVYGPIVLLLGVAIGFLVPQYTLDRAIQERQRSIRRVMADTIDLLTLSVEAGLSLDGAMREVVDRMNNPLTAELAIVLQLTQMGKSKTEALRALGNRIRIPELTSFISAICQSEQLGFSIAKVLRVQSESLRISTAQTAREEAAKLPVKLLFPMIFMIFPAVFVVILGPGVMQIAKSFGVLK
jgi:tight adherence protein C